MFTHLLLGRLGLFVGVLLLLSACGDGEISGVRGGARLGPEASGDGDGEMCSNGSCIDAPPNSPPPRPAGTPYGHVVPADLGVTIGPGVVAPVPTTPYTGPNPITVNGTVIENVTYDDILEIRADNVTVRNVAIDCAHASCWYAILTTNVSNLLVEYSSIRNRLDGKAILLDENCFNCTFSKNEIRGGQDPFMFRSGVFDNIVVEDNYIHSLVGDSGAHTDGVQYYVDQAPAGSLTMRGNYWWINNPVIGVTDLFVPHLYPVNFLFENNYLRDEWNTDTHRCKVSGTVCDIRNNIYDASGWDWVAGPGARCEYGCAAAGFDVPGPHVFRCNRYSNGNFIEQSHIIGAYAPTHDITGCASYP